METESQCIRQEADRQCRGVIVCEDLPTGRRAEELWNRVARVLGEVVPCRADHKSAAEIKEQLDFAGAEETDILIISVHDLPIFIFDAGRWLDDWLSVRPRLPRALFILHDGPKDDPIVAFLEKLTGFVGVTLFSCGREGCETRPRSDPGEGHPHGDRLALVA